MVPPGRELKTTDYEGGGRGRRRERIKLSRVESKTEFCNGKGREGENVWGL